MTRLADVAELYVAFFKRAPDAAGLTYWLEQLDSGAMSLEAMATNWMLEQPEALERYPTSMSPAEFIESIYQNVLGRDADTDGLAYWAEQVQSGAVARDAFVAAIVNGAKSNQSEQGQRDAALLNNKAAVGAAFAERGLNDTALAASVLTTVTDNPDTAALTRSIISLLPSEPGAVTPDVLSAVNNALGTVRALIATQPGAVANAAAYLEAVSANAGGTQQASLLTNISSALDSAVNDPAVLDDPASLANETIVESGGEPEPEEPEVPPAEPQPNPGPTPVDPTPEEPVDPALPLAAKIVGGVLSLVSNADRPFIIAELREGIWVFSLSGSDEELLVDATKFTSLNLTKNQTLNGVAAELSTLNVSGTGHVSVRQLTAEDDLSSLADELNVQVWIEGNVDITSAANGLATVDEFTANVMSGSGNTFQLTAEQADGRILSGGGGTIVVHGSDGDQLIDVQRAFGENIVMGGAGADRILLGGGKDVVFIGGRSEASLQDSFEGLSDFLASERATVTDEALAERLQLLEAQLNETLELEVGETATPEKADAHRASLIRAFIEAEGAVVDGFTVTEVPSHPSLVAGAISAERVALTQLLRSAEDAIAVEIELDASHEAIAAALGARASAVAAAGGVVGDDGVAVGGDDAAVAAYNTLAELAKSFEKAHGDLSKFDSLMQACDDAEDAIWDFDQLILDVDSASDGLAARASLVENVDQLHQALSEGGIASESKAALGEYDRIENFDAVKDIVVIDRGYSAVDRDLTAIGDADSSIGRATIVDGKLRLYATDGSTPFTVSDDVALSMAVSFLMNSDFLLMDEVVLFDYAFGEETGAFLFKFDGEASVLAQLAGVTDLLLEEVVSSNPLVKVSADGVMTFSKFEKIELRVHDEYARAYDKSYGTRYVEEASLDAFNAVEVKAGQQLYMTAAHVGEFAIQGSGVVIVASVTNESDLSSIHDDLHLLADMAESVNLTEGLQFSNVDVFRTQEGFEGGSFTAYASQLDGRAVGGAWNSVKVLGSDGNQEINVSGTGINTIDGGAGADVIHLDSWIGSTDIIVGSSTGEAGTWDVVHGFVVSEDSVDLGTGWVAANGVFSGQADSNGTIAAVTVTEGRAVFQDEAGNGVLIDTEEELAAAVAFLESNGLLSANDVLMFDYELHGYDSGSVLFQASASGDVVIQLVGVQADDVAILIAQ